MIDYNTRMERIGYGMTLIGVFGGIGLCLAFFLVARFDGQWNRPEIATLAAMLGAIILTIGGVQLRKRSGAVVSPNLRPDGTPHPSRDTFRDAIMIGVVVTLGSLLAMAIFASGDRDFSLYLVGGIGIIGWGLWGKHRSGRE